MKFIKYIFFGLILFISGCNKLPAQKKVSDASYQKMLEKLLSHKVQEISVEEAAELTNPIFLDARENEEFNVSHIQNAVHVGYNDFNIENLSQLNNSDTLIVYCSVGYRSEKITQKLIKAGFHNTFNLFGGIFEWVNQDLPIVNQGEETNNVHAYDEYWGKWLRKGEKVY